MSDRVPIAICIVLGLLVLGVFVLVVHAVASGAGVGRERFVLCEQRCEPYRVAAGAPCWCDLSTVAPYALPDAGKGTP
jgi:hypothetical protein